MRRILALALFLSVPAWINAQNIVPPLANQQLADSAQEARATRLMGGIRCIQCQGQSIHDSDAPIAAAMRHEVRSRIKAGESDAQINSWLKSRYGEWISFEPPSHGAGLILWVLPLLLLGAAVTVASSRFRNQKP